MALTASTWMTHSVTLLNVTFEALEQIPAERAIVLIQSGDAEAIENVEPGFVIHSQFLSIPLPKVIKLNRYVLVKHHVIVTEHSKASAVGILRRDKNMCGYCGEFAATIDHIMPQSRGGGDTWSNLVAACSTCNSFKADRTPEEACMTLLWPPKVPRYDEKRQKQIWKTVASDDTIESVA